MGKNFLHFEFTIRNVLFICTVQFWFFSEQLTVATSQRKVQVVVREGRGEVQYEIMWETRARCEKFVFSLARSGSLPLLTVNPWTVN